MKKPVYLLILFAIMALIVSGCSEPTIDGDEKPYVGYIALDISNAAVAFTVHCMVLITILGAGYCPDSISRIKIMSLTRIKKS